jgi:hypothetical protein
MSHDESTPALTFYRTNEARHREAKQKAQAASARLSHARLAVFGVAFLSVSVLGYFGFYPVAAVLGLVGALLFFVLVRRHEVSERVVLEQGHLLSINEVGLARQTGNWKTFPERGDTNVDPLHPFADDLDLFGKASLYQWICAAETRYGKAHLAALLKAETQDSAAIQDRQVMVRELAGKPEWRQAFQAAGRAIVKSKEDPDALVAWSEGADVMTFPMSLRIVLRAWGLLSPISMIVFGFLIPIPALVALPLVVNGLILGRLQRKVKPLVAGLCFQRHNLEAYPVLLDRIEQSRFSSSGLAQLAEGLRTSPKSSAQQARELLTIAEWLDIRANPMVHSLLNFVVLWDLQWLVQFQDWKNRSGKALRGWLEGIGRMEVLASLSQIAFENPTWAFPEISDTGKAVFLARNLGHPLIAAESRVGNDFTLHDPNGGVILTGSNMTGKSTWLRTVGINLVLAYAGAPVCAHALQTSVFQVRTSMRLKDDLDQGISSFYAELLRLRGIVDAAKSHAKVLYLIDEIFRGTNSIDRVAGAREVLLRMAKLGALGLASTHDLELGRLADDHPALFRNCHFSERFEGDAIRFDHKLQSGISQTRNARHLMRLSGVIDSE